MYIARIYLHGEKYIPKQGKMICNLKQTEYRDWRQQETTEWNDTRLYAAAMIIR